VGRHSSEIQMLPGTVPFLASIEAAATAWEQEFNELISPEYSLRQLSTMLGLDLTARSLDAPLPPLPPIGQIQCNKSRYQLIAKLGGGRGHRTFAGTHGKSPRRVPDVVASA
jgi:alkanesulfonate monooxygenase SsuD/methylene tetrahydromethanopterin reductase-like flavin-dependent oxidoreductase (luciferase family)